MRKGILLFLLFLTACQPKKEEIILPTQQELGKICTIVHALDENMIHVVIHYTQNERYPNRNENEIYKINDMILKYSSSGFKDPNQYPIDIKKTFHLCGVDSNVKTIQIVTQIPSDDFQKFMKDLKEYEFNYEIEINDESIEILIPNEVYFESRY